MITIKISIEAALFIFSLIVAVVGLYYWHKTSSAEIKTLEKENADSFNRLRKAIDQANEERAEYRKKVLGENNG